MDGGLRDAIHVHQTRAPFEMAAIPRLQAAKLQSLTAEDHHAESQTVRSVPGLLIRLHQSVEGRRRLVEDRDRMLREQVSKRLGRPGNQLRNDHQPATVQQCAPEFPHREIESVGVEHRPGVKLVEMQPTPGRLE